MHQICCVAMARLLFVEIWEMSILPNDLGISVYSLSCVTTRVVCVVILDKGKPEIPAKLL